MCGDIKQAFVQVRIKEEDRDALRFYWIKEKDPKQIDTLRFTRALFGLVQSPSILGGTLDAHLESKKGDNINEIAEIKKSLYADDFISEGINTTAVKRLKQLIINIFGEAQFILHKWHSNVPELEDDNNSEEIRTYAKAQLGVEHNETKIFGLTWDKSADTLDVTFPKLEVDPTKRGILQKLASCYDHLGLVSPILLGGKSIYREVCELGTRWNPQLPEAMLKKWSKWNNNLPEKMVVPRAFRLQHEKIEAIDFHVFSDASIIGTAVALYAAIYKSSGTSQGKFAAKSRLSIKNRTIPRLELVAMHMAANLCKEEGIGSCSCSVDKSPTE